MTHLPTQAQIQKLTHNYCRWLSLQPVWAGLNNRKMIHWTIRMWSNLLSWTSLRQLHNKILQTSDAFTCLFVFYYFIKKWKQTLFLYLSRKSNTKLVEQCFTVNCPYGQKYSNDDVNANKTRDANKLLSIHELLWLCVNIKYTGLWITFLKKLILIVAVNNQHM